MAVTKRTMVFTVKIEGTPQKFYVYPDGTTFQGFQKYEVVLKNGVVVHRYQTDATKKYEILAYLQNVLPTLFCKGFLKSSPNEWCGF